MILWLGRDLERKLNLDEFSIHYNKNIRKLLDWLITFVDSNSGKSSNLGSNDGAYCYTLHDLPFEDFRPSIQLASRFLTIKNTIAKVLGTAFIFL